MVCSVSTLTDMYEVTEASLGKSECPTGTYSPPASICDQVLTALNLGSPVVNSDGVCKTSTDKLACTKYSQF